MLCFRNKGRGGFLNRLDIIKKRKKVRKERMVIKGLTFKRIRNMNRETLLKSIRKERFRLKKTLSM